MNALKEMKVYVSLSQDGKMLFAVPVNKAIGTVFETKIMTARLYTKEEIDRELKETMNDGIRAYKKVNGRIRETR